METQAAVETFSKYFTIVPANTSALQNIVYQIRYQVYCQEFHFEREEDCPSRMENDRYDAHSSHCLLIHEPNKNPVGCVRLIGPDPNNPELPLPFEPFCQNPDYLEILDPKTLPRGSFGEFSRLAVLQTFRRRKSDEKKPVSMPDWKTASTSGRNAFPVIPVSLFLAALSMLLHNGFNYGFAMMEPCLARLLRRFEIDFNQIGDVVDYHGPRGPFFISREKILSGFTSEIQSLIEVIYQQIYDAPYPNPTENQANQ